MSGVSRSCYLHCRVVSVLIPIKGMDIVRKEKIHITVVVKIKEDGAEKSVRDRWHIKHNWDEGSSWRSCNDYLKY